MKVDAFAYINQYYGLSLKKGKRVMDTTKNKTGTVAKGDGNYIYILWDGDLKPTGPYHPTSNLEYTDEAAKAKIANVGPEKVMERVRAGIARCGVANGEAVQ